MMELCLFYNGPESARLAREGGIDTLVIDCEFHGKHERQQGYNTEINQNTPADVAIARAIIPGMPLLCRINGLSEDPDRSLTETRIAVDAGADEILIPMVRSFAQLEQVLTVVNGRARVGLMLETDWAVENAAALDQYPLSRVFVGLSDLMVERRSRNLFENLWNGTVSTLRGQIASARFGFGGLTLPTQGVPIPCRLLMAELARMRTDFTFLRRSFYRDLAQSQLAPEAAVQSIRDAWKEMESRSPAAVEQDRIDLWSLFGSAMNLS